VEGLTNKRSPKTTSNEIAAQFENQKFLKVLMSATGTRLDTVELYGAGAQT
jgi:hypothetical protein